MTDLEMIEELEKEDLQLLEEVEKEEQVESHVKDNIALVQEPEEEETGAIMGAIKKWNYYNNELGRGIFKGILEPIAETTEWLGDVAGIQSVEDFGGDADAYLEKQLATTSTLGDITETVSRVGTGIFLTKGLGTGVLANTGKGALIDMFMFDGDEGNIADIAEDFGFKSELIDYLKTDKDDSETLKRLKNAITGAGLGLSLDAIIGTFSYGKKLFSKQGNAVEFKGTDEELVKEIGKTVTEDSKFIAEKQAKAQAEVVEKGVKNTDEVVEKADNFGTDLMKQADEFVNQVEKDVGLDLKQPLNAEKIAEGSEEVLAKATEGVEANVKVKTHAETIADIDRALEKQIGKESFDLMADMVKTSKGLENLDVKVGQQRVIVGTLAKALDDSIKVAQKDQSVLNMAHVMQNLKNLNTTATTLKNTQSGIARAMSSMRINTANTEMMNTLKLMDALDPDNTMLRLENALNKGDKDALADWMANINDVSKDLKSKVENMADSKYKKITNALSESMVAGMLSAPSTLAVNVIGNTLVKHQRFLQDTMQFVWGQTLRSKDRMSTSTYRHLVSANAGSWFRENKIIGKNMIAWANLPTKASLKEPWTLQRVKEGFKNSFRDEVYDDAVLVKFKQDQDFAHKYIDAKYLRGKEAGSTNSFTNNAINMSGKIARSPYNLIGYVDDYYKRTAFRAELVRVGGQLADSKNLKGAEFDTFMNKFIQANTELRLIMNQGKAPKDAWIVANKEYIGNGDGLDKYARYATDSANYMTFQKDLGDGLVGKGVNLLNSDGILRILVPFKMTPINILKHAVSTASDPIVQALNGQIAKGGVQRDIALAKISMSVGILTTLGTVATSGRITGTFTPEERQTMTSAGIQELSVKIGDKWYEYKQVEPYATIAGVMADATKLFTDLDYRIQDAEIREEVGQEYMSFVADMSMALVNNVANKTYAKSLFEVMSVANGEKDLVDYGGNLLSSVVPLSSLVNYTGRVTNEGFKKEAKTFTERLRSKFRVLLERDALDLYGRPIKDMDYLGYVAVKQYDANDVENRGTKEVARLGIIVKQMPKSVNLKKGGVMLTKKLDEVQYHKLRASLHKNFKLVDMLNKTVDTENYKRANRYKQKAILEKTISAVKSRAMKKILLDKKLVEGIKRDAQVTINAVNRPQGTRSTWNDLIIGGQ